MKKSETIGEIGEELFKDIIIKNNIPYIDLRDNIVNKNFKVGSYNNKSEYNYNSNILSHPFDFIINGKNIEIKTSRIIDGFICFNWTKNDIKNIDYVIGIVLDKNKRINYFIVFNNKYINTHKAFRSNNKYNNYEPLSELDILEILK